MFDFIVQGLKNTSNEEFASTLNDVKRVRDFDWTEHRYAVLGNENGKWFTSVVVAKTLNDCKVEHSEYFKKYHSDDVIAEAYFNKMN